jgi:membrane protein
VVFWLIVSWAFGAYAVSVSAYALYYGSLAAVAVLLVWLYLTSLSLVLGAEVNADLERVDSRAPRTGRVARR